MRISLLWLLASARLSGGQEEVLLTLDAGNSRISLYRLADLARQAAYATPVLCRPEGACGLAFSGYSAFFADATDADRLIYELNPRDGAVWNTLPFPGSAVDGLAFDQGVLYALGFAEDRIYRLDPFSGQVLGMLAPGVDLVGGLGAGDGRLFASRIRPPRLFEIEPGTGQVLRELSTSSLLPTGLGFFAGSLYVGDFQRGLLLRARVDEPAAEETLAVAVGKIAALEVGLWSASAPYEVRLEQVGEELLAQGEVEFALRVALVDKQGRLLAGNNHSQIEWSLQGAGELVDGAALQVRAGEAQARVRLPLGGAGLAQARVSGLQPAVLQLGAIARAARLALALEMDPADSTLVMVSASLWDALGAPALEDTGAVSFVVVRGGGVVVGPAVVAPQQGQARTWVRLARRQGEVVVAVQGRAARQTATFAAPGPEPETPAPRGRLTVAPLKAGGRDEIPPLPPQGVRAARDGSQVEVRWQASATDGQVRFFPFGEGMVREALLWGYRIYRSRDSGLFEEIGRAAPGAERFVDSPGDAPGTYRYKVLAEDQDNLSEVLIQPHSPEDRQRTVVIGRGALVDAEGKPVLGLFNDDLVVDFDDFFLFADHFGTSSQGSGFDPLFDLDQDGAVGFDDFFLFADHFGKEAIASP